MDPGSPYPAEQQRLRRVLWRLRGRGGRVAAVLLTHHHEDHVADALALCEEQDAPLAAHPETLSRLRFHGRRPELLRVEEGHRLACDAGELLCVHTPGHAPGHLCLFESHRHILVAGDMVAGDGTTLVAPPDGDMALFLRSLRRLAELRPGRILPAHGPVILDGQAAIRRLIAHRIWRERRILQALADGARHLGELTLRAYDDVSLWRLPLAMLSTRAHLIKLDREGLVHPVGQHRWAPAAAPPPTNPLSRRADRATPYC